MKPIGGTNKKQDLKDRHNPIKSKRKPPRGMYLNHEDLKTIALGPPGQGDAILKSMDLEVIALKRQVQNSKQIISALKHKTSSGIDDFRPPESSTRMNARWNNDELLLAVQGVRKYGKDFKAIAELIGNKTEAHIKSFFVNYRRRYNLDAILQEYEAENGPIIDDDKDDKMDIECSPTNSASNSNSGSSTPVTNTFLSVSTALSNTTSNNSSSLIGSSSANNLPVTLITSVPPPLLKPVQSPSIMNRPPPPPPLQQQQTVANRFPISRTAPQQPPPLIRPNSIPIMAAMRPSHNQPPQLSTRE